MRISSREVETIGNEVYKIHGPEYTIDGVLVDETVFYVRRTEARLVEFMKGFGSGE